MVQTRSSFLIKTRPTTMFKDIPKSISKTPKIVKLEKTKKIVKLEKTPKIVKLEKTKKQKLQKEIKQEIMTEFSVTIKQEPVPEKIQEPVTEKIQEPDPEKIQEPVPEPFSFDDAHDCWMSNKKLLSNGLYAYLCLKPLSNGKTCKNICCDKIGLYGGCKLHFMWDE